jgi:hypothetical protein
MQEAREDGHRDSLQAHHCLLQGWKEASLSDSFFLPFRGIKLFFGAIEACSLQFMCFSEIMFYAV